MSVIDAGKTKRRNVIGYVTFPLRDLPAENEQTLYKMDLEKVSTTAAAAAAYVACKKSTNGGKHPKLLKRGILGKKR
jgi:hypothetical protein